MTNYQMTDQPQKSKSVVDCEMSLCKPLTCTSPYKFECPNCLQHYSFQEMVDDTAIIYCVNCGEQFIVEPSKFQRSAIVILDQQAPPPPPPTNEKVSMKNYYIHDKSETTGPFEESRIKQMLSEGNVTMNAKICEVGDQAWSAISSMMPPPPPPAPAPAPQSQFHPKIYRTNKVGMAYRVTTGNIIPKSQMLDAADFQKTQVTFTMRNGKTYTFNYNDCNVTDSLLGNYETVTLKIKSQNPKQSLKIHILYPKEMSEQEINEIRERLKVGSRLFEL